MHILLTGGTGFIGKALCHALLQAGHQLTILSRQALPNQNNITFCQQLDNVDSFDAIINLAGEPIFDKAWTSTQKQKLLESRITLTHKLALLIRQSPTPPSIFLSGSATGYYGDCKGNPYCDETTPNGTEFPAQLCQQWEENALLAQSAKTRICLLRTGIVLDKSGGALHKMLPLYRLGLGGKLGTGKQHWAWISLTDHIRSILFLLNHPNCSGAYNLVSPTPITHTEFNRALANHLKRPAIFNSPKWLLNGILGERSQLLLDNQPLLPSRLLQAGFEFEHPTFQTFLTSKL